MSEFVGFIGPSYRSFSKYASVERCVNWFLEVVEDPNERKNRMVLYPTPCTGTYGPSVAATVYSGVSRQLLELNGRLFGVNGPTFFEFLAPSALNPQGKFVNWGTVLNDNTPVGMVGNGTSGSNQILIVSSGNGYIFNTKDNSFSNVLENFIAGQGAAFLDDYFCSIIPGTNGFQVSQLNNGLNWGSIGTNTINVAFLQGQSDNLVNLVANIEYLYLFGSRRSEVWFNQGGQFFPLAEEPGAFIEMGLGGQWAFAKANNTVHLLGQDSRGGLSMWYLNGLTPVRCSTHALELALSTYSTVADCITYSFTWRGHLFVRYIFPTAQAGWTYDVTASTQLGYAVWHENSLTDANSNTLAPLERTHAYFNGTHVVGSGGGEGAPGTLYQFTDTTNVDVDPVILLRYSNDGGNTFGNENTVPVGKAGQYEVRAIADLQGAGRDRVYWARCIDYGDAGGTLPITRDRITPHIFNENKRVFYHRIEIAAQKGMGSVGGVSTPVSFWALTGAYLTYEAGLN